MCCCVRHHWHWLPSFASRTQFRTILIFCISIIMIITIIVCVFLRHKIVFALSSKFFSTNLFCRVSIGRYHPAKICIPTQNYEQLACKESERISFRCSEFDTYTKSAFGFSFDFYVFRRTFTNLHSHWMYTRFCLGDECIWSSANDVINSIFGNIQISNSCSNQYFQSILWKNEQCTACNS